MNRWQSNAQWDLSVYSMDGGITTDTHETYAEARHICNALVREGFGGQRQQFPIRTWVSKIAARETK